MPTGWGFRSATRTAATSSSNATTCNCTSWKTDDPQFPRDTSCYIRGGQVAALHEEYSARGVPNLSPFLVRPWNMKEFHSHDPHGNLLKFGCGEW